MHLLFSYPNKKTINIHNCLENTQLFVVFEFSALPDVRLEVFRVVKCSVVL
jgi:hypothetical protein